MGSKPAVLQCSKCGKGPPPPLPVKPGTPAPDTSKCPYCQGRVVRICGSCGFRNSAAKNYCDICGDMLMLGDGKSAPPKPGAQAPASKPAPLEPQRFIVIKPPAPSPPKPQTAPPPAPKAQPAPQPKAPEPGPFAPKASPPPQEGDGPFSPKRYEVPKPEPPSPFAPKTPPAEPPPPDEPGPFSPLRWQKPKVEKAPEPTEPQPRAESALPAGMRVPQAEPQPRAVKAPAPEPAASDEPGPFSPLRWQKPTLEKASEPAAPPAQPASPAPASAPSKPEPPRQPSEPAPAQSSLSLVPAQKPEPEPEPAIAPAAETQEPYPEFKSPARSPFLDAPKTGIIRIADRTPKETPEEAAPAQASKEDKAKFRLRAENTGVLRDKMAKRHIELRHSPGENAKAQKPERPTFTRTRALASTSVGILLLVAGLLLYGFYYWNFRRNPRVRVVRNAGKYLSAIQTGDLETAYGMLSPISRSNCPKDDFRRLQGSDRTFGSVVLESLEKDWASIRYESRTPKGETLTEFMDFVLDDGRWMRAFNANQLEAAESAILSLDFDLADQFARGALAVNPRDALARSYQCETAYYQNRIQDAVGECSAAIDLAKQAPSEMDEHRLFYVHGILSDLYKNRLDRPAEAVREYNILLALPGQSPAQRCDILLARADARAMLNAPQEALKDYQEASGVCSASDDLEYAQRSVKVFSGQAGGEAVAAVQHHRTADDESTLSEWREKARRELAAKLKAQGSKLRPGQESWSPEHLSGPNYRVSLRNADVEILSAKVDLWSRKVKVDVYVQ